MNALVKVIDGIERQVERIEDVALSVLVVLALCLTMAQVVFRYIVHSPLVWSEELVLYLFVWIVMVGAAVALRQRGHFALTTFIENLPRSATKILGALTDVIIATFSLVLLVQGIGMTAMGFHEEAASFPVRMGWFYLAIPVGGGLMCWHLFARTMRPVPAPTHTR